MGEEDARHGEPLLALAITRKSSRSVFSVIDHLKVMPLPSRMPGQMGDAKGARPEVSMKIGNPGKSPRRRWDQCGHIGRPRVAEEVP